MSSTGNALMGMTASREPEEVSAPGGENTEDTAQDGAGEEDTDAPVVLCTILLNADSTFQLIKGDEEDGGEEDGMSGEAAEGMPPAAGGVAARPAGESFDSPGPLLKAVLDMLKEAEDRNGGSAQENFDAGFNANTEAKPKAM